MARRWDSDRPALGTVSSPPSEPHFRGAKPTRRAAELIVVLLLTRVTYSGVRGVFRGGRGRRCTSVALDYIINVGERK